MGKTVVLGLSGGVDSAVAARLLLEDGYTVYGHWLDIGLGGREEAAAVAASLGIPFSTGDIREELAREVMTPFRADYLAGRTPLPCARCNPTVKFPALFRRAEEVGADCVATGHYARIVADETGQVLLCRGGHANDQAYMLARLPKALLPRLVFPLGPYEKVRVRQLARDYGLPVADKPDSMEICFIPDGDYPAFIEARGLAGKAGHFISPDGADLGPHQGVLHYTVGQRKGLGIALGEPVFIREICENGDIRLARGGEEYFTTVTVAGLVTPDGAALPAGEYLVKVRSAAPAQPAVFDGTDTLTFASPVRAPAPGQTAAFYRGGAVAGSGFITHAE